MFTSLSDYKKIILLSILVFSFSMLVSCTSPEFKINVSYNEEQGEVEGQGIYQKNDKAELTVKSSEGYKFSHWEENGEKIEIVSLTLIFNVTKDHDLKVIFIKKEKYPVKVVSSNKEFGKVNELDVNLTEGRKITLKAIPKEGCKFEGWFLNGSKISSELRYQVVIEKASEIVGRFNEVKTYSLKVNTNIKEFAHLINVNNEEYKDAYSFKEGKTVSISLNHPQMIEKGLHKKYKYNGSYINKNLFTAKQYYDFEITEDTTIDVKFDKSSFDYYKIFEEKIDEKNNCEELPEEFDVVKTSPDEKKILAILGKAAYIISPDNDKCIAKYDVSNLVREQYFDRYIHWLDNSDGFYIVKKNSTDGYQTLKVFYLDYRVISIETSQDYPLDTFFGHIENKGSTISYSLAVQWEASVLTTAFISINLETLEVSIKEILNYTSTETPQAHSGIVLSKDGSRLFYNYNDGQIWDVNENNIFTGVLDLKNKKKYEFDTIFSYLENPKDNSIETTGNKTHGTPKYWLNEDQVLSLLDEDSLYIINEPFFAHLYIFDTISEDVIFVDSDLNSVYDIKKIDNPNNLDKKDFYITASRESDKTMFYFTTIKNEINQMTQDYATEIFSKRGIQSQANIEYFPKKYDKFVETTDHELFSLPGNYRYIDKAIYMKDGNILIVIRNGMAHEEDKVLALIDNDRNAKIIYENSKGFELIKYSEDEIKVAVPNDSSKYEFVNINY